MDASTLDLGLLVLRIGVGVPFALHGTQKLLGWFGGGGFSGTSAWFASLGFGTGLLAPLAAAMVVGTMTTAAFVNNAEAGFWSVAKGWELNGYLIVVATALAVAGPGALSLDAILDLPGRAGVPFDGTVGVLSVAVGAVGGWLRWVTRTRR
jgi:putative oxidoreductase